MPIMSSQYLTDLQRQICQLDVNDLETHKEMLVLALKMVDILRSPVERIFDTMFLVF